MPNARPDLYISADVETDGPVPGPFSMLSFGLVVIGSFDGNRLSRPDGASQTTFYRELRPIADTFQPEALEVNGLDRERLLTEGEEPEQAMTAAAAWVQEKALDHRPVLVAYPVAFDWSFLYWYFNRFSTIGSPFGHSSCLDIRTLYQAMAGTVFDRSAKRYMPPSFIPRAPHTHNALDDAVEQGELFANVMEWVIRRRASFARDRDTPGVPSWFDGHLMPLA